MFVFLRRQRGLSARRVGDSARKSPSSPHQSPRRRAESLEHRTRPAWLPPWLCGPAPCRGSCGARGDGADETRAAAPRGRALAHVWHGPGLRSTLEELAGELPGPRGTSEPARRRRGIHRHDGAGSAGRPPGALCTLRRLRDDDRPGAAHDVACPRRLSPPGGAGLRSRQSAVQPAMPTGPADTRAVAVAG
jgi:hypothetical protein